MRAANNELTRRIHIVRDVKTEEVEHLLRMNLLFDTGDKDIDDIILNLRQHRLVIGKLIVLRRNYNSVDTFGHALVAVLHRHLTLRVGTQVGHHLALFADVGQRAHNEVGQVERDWHIRLCFVGSITEHHALVASALFFLISTVDTAIDILTLLVYGTEDAARVTVKLILRLGVANALDGVTGYRLQVNIHIAAHLTHQHHLSRCDERFASHTGMGIVSQELVQYSVTYLVRHLVGMAFRHRL